MMNKKKFLIAIPTYKESENIKKLIIEINNLHPDFDILIINDFSNDNIKETIDSLKINNIHFIERPRKLGLGTAHKLGLFYAIKNKYDFVITMDADLSHDPKEIKSLVDKADENSFVIGSRFCNGGKLDYSGFRRLVSIGGNLFGTKILNLEIKEITTYFRVYSVKLLKKLHYEKLNAQGYSLGVKIIWMMSKLGANLIEVPIHFRDRNKGKSKIPKFQIFVSFFDLLFIKFYENLFKLNFDNENNSYKFKNHCEKANDCFFSLKKKDYICLVCNLKLK